MEKNFENIFSSNGLNYVPGIPLDLADPALSRSDNFTGKYGIDLSKSWYQNHKNKGKEKNLDKIMLEKGALRDIIETTKNLTPEETIAKLELYQGVMLGKDTLNKSGKDALNMFEMIALYQRSIQHLTTLKIKVDARFGPRTFEKLMKTQKDVLHFNGKAADGIPGPKTTKAIIDALTLALDTAKNSDHTTSLAADKLRAESIASLEYSNKIISDLHALIGTDSTNLSAIGRDPTKTFYSGKNMDNVNFAQVIEEDGVSVWGKIAKDGSRPLIIKTRGTIYVGNIMPDGTLTDKMGVWPVWKDGNAYRYMPKTPIVNRTK